MKDKIKEKLIEEIEKAKSKNCLKYDDYAEDKWKPMMCKLCKKHFARRGFDRHLNYAHGIIRFDFGIREAKLQQHEETKEWVLELINNFDFGKYLESVEEVNDDTDIYYGIDMDNLLKGLKKELEMTSSFANTEKSK